MGPQALSNLTVVSQVEVLYRAQANLVPVWGSGKPKEGVV
jgi:hypothetical protein